MRMPSKEKIVFFASSALFVWLYGYATGAKGWFPNSLIVQAWNQMEAVVSSQASDVWSSDAVYERKGVRIINADRVATGLTLVSARWEESDWQPSVRLIDVHGNTVHEWLIEPYSIFSERNRIIHGFKLLPGGDLLANIDYAGTVKVDACGRVEWKLDVNSHHSIHRAEDGSFWIAAMRERKSPHDVWEIDGPGPIYHDLIINISKDGEILQKINVLEALAQNDGTLPYLIRHQQGDDVTHLNDVEPLSTALAPEYPLFEPGDILLSLKHLNMVAVLDPQTNEVRWHAVSPFIQQHDPDFVGDGWIGVFDNREDGTYRGRRLGGSRIVALQPHTDSVKSLYDPTGLGRFHTPNMGNWQRLSNGNVLLVESRAGRVLEVTPNSEPVWEWIAPRYNESQVPEVYQAARYNISREEVATWPCSDVGATTPSRTNQ